MYQHRCSPNARLPDGTREALKLRVIRHVLADLFSSRGQGSKCSKPLSFSWQGETVTGEPRGIAFLRDERDDKDTYPWLRHERPGRAGELCVLSHRSGCIFPQYKQVTSNTSHTHARTRAPFSFSLLVSLPVSRSFTTRVLLAGDPAGQPEQRPRGRQCCAGRRRTVAGFRRSRASGYRVVRGAWTRRRRRRRRRRGGRRRRRGRAGSTARDTNDVAGPGPVRQELRCALAPSALDDPHDGWSRVDRRRDAVHGEECREASVSRARHARFHAAGGPRLRPDTRASSSSRSHRRKYRWPDCQSVTPAAC